MFAYLMRKPMSSSIIRSVVEHGTGALNIDLSRIGSEGPLPPTARVNVRKQKLNGDERKGAALGMFQSGASFVAGAHPLGRYPMNVILKIQDEKLKFFKKV